MNSAAFSALFVGLAICAGPALAAEPLQDSQLAGTRAGYVSANGLTFGFGAVVRTFVDGALALETTLNLPDGSAPFSGPVSQTGGAAQLAGLPGQGVVLPGNGGSTAVAHSLTENQFLNLVINSASDRDIRQDTAVTITLPQFEQLQLDAATAKTAAELQSALGLGIAGAARR